MWALSRKLMFHLTSKVSIFHHIQRLKLNNHMITSVAVDKTFDKIQNPYI